MSGFEKKGCRKATSIACLGLVSLLVAHAAVATWVPPVDSAVTMARKTLAEGGSLTNNTVWEDYKLITQPNPNALCQTASTEGVTISHPWVPSGHSVMTRSVQGDPVEPAPKAVLDVQCVSNWSGWGFAPAANFRALSRCTFDVIPNPPVTAGRKRVWLWLLAIGSPNASIGQQLPEAGPWGPAALMSVRSDAGNAVVALNQVPGAPRFTLWTQRAGDPSWTYQGASETVNRIVVFEKLPTGGFMTARQGAGLGLTNPGPLANGIFAFGSYGWTVWETTPLSGAAGPVVFSP